MKIFLEWCETVFQSLPHYFQDEVDECQSSPCGPHGLCVDQIAGYVCYCSNGFTGNQLTCTDTMISAQVSSFKPFKFPSHTHVTSEK